MSIEFSSSSSSSPFVPKPAIEIPESESFPPDWDSGELPPPLAEEEIRNIVNSAARDGRIEARFVEETVKLLLRCGAVFYDDYLDRGKGNCYHRSCGGSGMFIKKNGTAICSKCGQIEGNFAAPSFLK